jgi:mannitol/fructose-specific phosphotransferase system IIA component (Ntr-type)
VATAIALTDLLDLRDIHLNFEAGSVIEAIPLLLRPPLMRRLHDESVVNTIIDAAIAREKESATLCGTLALPHARHPALDDFVVSLAITAAGGNPRLIFAFASPQGKREQHLQLLASLARLSQNASLVDQIASATSADQVLDALRSAGI